MSIELIGRRVVRASTRGIARIPCHLPCNVCAVGHISLDLSYVFFSALKTTTTDLDQGIGLVA